MHMKRLLPLFLAALAAAGCNGGPLAGFKADAPSGAPEPVAESRLDYNGYTNHWQSVYRTHYKYGNLYRVNLPDLAKGAGDAHRQRHGDANPEHDADVLYRLVEYRFCFGVADKHK